VIRSVGDYVCSNYQGFQTDWGEPFLLQLRIRESPVGMSEKVLTGYLRLVRLCCPSAAAAVFSTIRTMLSRSLAGLAGTAANALSRR
jgi:hypothetical protein